MEYTVDIDGLHELGCVGLGLTAASRAADGVRLVFASDVVDAVPVPWGHGDEVVLTRGGDVVARGYVLEMGCALGAGSYDFEVSLGNVVAMMDAVPYVEGQGFRGVVADDGTRLVSAASMVRRLAEAGAVAPGGAASGDGVVVDFDASIKCPKGSGTQSCWSLVEDVLHWVPDAVSFYDPAERVLRFCRGGERGVLVLDVAAGVGRIGDEVVMRFGGVDGASFVPRYDLRPPVVGMVWKGALGARREFVLPADGSLRQPWAFLYEVPEMGGAGGLDDDGELSGSVRQAVQSAAGQRMEVEGVKVPLGWAITGNMREKSATAPGLLHEFWGRWFPALRKTGVGCLAYGQAVFEPTPVDEVYPPDEDGGTAADGSPITGQPANYEEFANTQQSIYVLEKGSFPASADARDNVSGLNFCHGVLKQYVWLSAEYAGTLTEEERKEFFKGSWSVTLDDGSRRGTRYALLTLRAVFIDRRRKRFKTGSNALLSGDDDYEEGDDSDGEDDDSAADGAMMADYEQATRDYYAATRILPWDGSISLLGVEDVALSRLVGCALSVEGLRSEWREMGTPVQRVEWDPFGQLLTISTGSTELLTVDERVERMRLGRQVAAGAGLTLPPESTVIDPLPPEEDGGDEEDEGFPMVAPSVNAVQEASAEGRPLNPFEVFQEGERWFMNEGVWPAPGGLLDWPTTDVTDVKARYRSVGIDVEFVDGEYKLVVRGYGKL